MQAQQFSTGPLLRPHQVAAAKEEIKSAESKLQNPGIEDKGEVVKQLKPGETSPIVQSRYGFHIVKLVEKDPGGQKEFSDNRVTSQIHQVIVNSKDQTLKNAFSEVARDKAQVTNYLAQRILDTAGK